MKRFRRVAMLLAFTIGATAFAQPELMLLANPGSIEGVRINESGDVFVRYFPNGASPTSNTILCQHGGSPAPNPIINVGDTIAGATLQSFLATAPLTPVLESDLMILSCTLATDSNDVEGTTAFPQFVVFDKDGQEIGGLSGLDPAFTGIDNLILGIPHGREFSSESAEIGASAQVALGGFYGNFSDGVGGLRPARA